MSPPGASATGRSCGAGAMTRTPASARSTSCPRRPKTCSRIPPSVNECDRRRGGVPAEPVLAAGGRAADDRRESRARDAAVGADRARDGRPPGARWVHHPRQGQDDRLHRDRRRARRGDRAQTPPDRALFDRRSGGALGRGPRGGRAPGARDVSGARGAHARGDRRRQDLPPRPPDRCRRTPGGGAAGRRRDPASSRGCRGSSPSATRSMWSSRRPTEDAVCSPRAWRRRSRSSPSPHRRPAPRCQNGSCSVSATVASYSER